MGPERSRAGAARHLAASRRLEDVTRVAPRRENGIRVGHTSPPSWLRAFSTPINSLIGRDLCGEFQLSTGIGLILDTAQGEITGEAWKFDSEANRHQVKSQSSS